MDNIRKYNHLTVQQHCRRWAEKIKKHMKRKHTQGVKDVEVLESAIVVSFYGQENALEWLRRTAAEDFRSVEQQAIFLLCEAARAAEGK